MKRLQILLTTLITILIFTSSIHAWSLFGLFGNPVEKHKKEIIQLMGIKFNKESASGPGINALAYMYIFDNIKNMLKKNQTLANICDVYSMNKVIVDGYLTTINPDSFLVQKELMYSEVVGTFFSNQTNYASHCMSPTEFDKTLLTQNIKNSVWCSLYTLAISECLFEDIIKLMKEANNINNYIIKDLKKEKSKIKGITLYAFNIYFKTSLYKEPIYLNTFLIPYYKGELILDEAITKFSLMILPVRDY